MIPRMMDILRRGLRFWEGGPFPFPRMRASALYGQSRFWSRSNSVKSPSYRHTSQSMSPFCTAPQLCSHEEQLGLGAPILTEQAFSDSFHSDTHRRTLFCTPADLLCVLSLTYYD